MLARSRSLARMELKLCSQPPSSSISSDCPCLPQRRCSLASFLSLPRSPSFEKRGHRKWIQIPRVCTETSSSPTDVASPSVRRLILLRHGKSSWSNPSIKDHDRPLNEHGRSASASLALKLRTVGWFPDLILCSDSVRTRETLNIMQEQIPEIGNVEVHFLGSFYSVSAMDGQTAPHLQETICKYAYDSIYTVMCMGHNRGWEEAASSFSGLTVELKTANAALLETSGSSWKEAFVAGGWKLSGIIKPDEINEP